MSFVYRHDQFDFGQIIFGPESETFWTISPPARHRMEKQISSGKPVQLFLKYIITRKIATGGNDLFNPISVGVQAWTLDNCTKLDFEAVLNGSKDLVVLRKITHPRLKISNDGQVKDVGNLSSNLALTRVGKKESEWWSLVTGNFKHNEPVSEHFAVYFAAERALNPFWNRLLEIGLVAFLIKKLS